MSVNRTLQDLVNDLQKLRPNIGRTLYGVQTRAARRAIKAAADATPPAKGSKNGTNTLTGQLKAHWATDSRPEPVGTGLTGGTEYVSVLANNMDYASYVNDGHRMDRHFVPGLYINPDSGLLEYDEQYGEYGGGLTVGTKHNMSRVNSW